MINCSETLSAVAMRFVSASVPTLVALGAVMLLGSGPLDLAWLNLAMSLPYLLFGLAAGILIDRVRRRPLIATDLIRAGLLMTISLVVPWACVAGYALSPLVLLLSRVRTLPRVEAA